MDLKLFTRISTMVQMGKPQPEMFQTIGVNNNIFTRKRKILKIVILIVYSGVKKYLLPHKSAIIYMQKKKSLAAKQAD